jgi:type 2 lantibiotic biosynthesis protein LanM
MAMLEDSEQAWPRALLLAERQAAGWRPDGEPALGLLGRWRAQPLADPDLWRRALRSRGLDDEQFLRLISPGAVSAPAPPWAAAFAALWQAPVIPPPPGPPRFSTLLAPLIDHSLRRLRAAVARLEPAPDLLGQPDLALGGLAEDLAGRLAALAGPTLVLELNIARLRGQLRGASGDERFADFIAAHADPRRSAALLGQYPVLVRGLIEEAELWLAAAERLLRHLCADWPDLRASLLAGRDPGALEAIDRSLGDRHRGGQSVALLRFASGDRLVYKPRSLAAEQHFQDLLGWANDRGFDPPLRRIALLERGDHGWMEFCAQAPCSSAAELGRFYRRQGGFLALLYLLEGTDIHLENIIAAGEHPLLIDLEGLFQPRRSAPGQAPTDATVLRVGLLPRRADPDAPAGPDLSGLAGAGGQLTAQPVASWAAIRTDTMYLDYARQPIPGGPNLPSLNGAAVNPAEFGAELVAGFRAMYRLLSEQRAALLDAAGPLGRFAGAEVRVLLRPSQSYALLLQRSLHPNLMRDAAERERLFDYLWAGLAEQPALDAVIPAERADLWQGDIPLFSTTPASLVARDSRGAAIAGLWPTASLELVRGRLADLSPADCDRQCQLIRESLAG